MRVLAAPVAFWVVALLAVRLIAVPAEGCEDVSYSSARASAALAAGWLTAGQNPDGTYTYQYDLEQGDINDYNIVRHAGVTMSLYQSAGVLVFPEAQTTADIALDWMLEHLTAHEDWVALSDDSEGKLGASALMVIALAERRLLTGDDRVRQHHARPGSLYHPPAAP